MADTFEVSLSPEQAAEMIKNNIEGRSVTGQLIDFYNISSPEGRKVFVMVFEKHYMRAGNRLTLTVTVDNLGARTRVHSVGGGGGEGLFRFDWGASESFASAARKALAEYIVR